MKLFSIGDKVRCIGGQWYGDVGEDNTGIVKGFDEYRGIAVEWNQMPLDEDQYECGHSCNGLCKEDFGYWVYEEDLELVKPAKQGNKARYM